MPDPKQQAAKQLANVLETTGQTMAQHAAEIRKAKLDKHAAIVAHFKTAHGLGHGHANLLAHVVREALAGGPADAGDLLEAQYAGKKAALRPIYEELAAIARGMGSDVSVVIQKTGVSFRRRKQFALVQAPSATRIRLGLHLPKTPKSPRVEEAKGMCSHTVDIDDPDAVDDQVTSWIRASYEAAG